MRQLISWGLGQSSSDSQRWNESLTLLQFLVYSHQPMSWLCSSKQTGHVMPLSQGSVHHVIAIDFKWALVNLDMHDTAADNPFTQRHPGAPVDIVWSLSSSMACASLCKQFPAQANAVQGLMHMQAMCC
jgi:hypothetical protein